ncbi:MAG: ABC transporter permease [Dehalococcoidales bacterium]|nr:ABC transporter permease [Dehalococcoidales bacterium]
MNWHIIRTLISKDITLFFRKKFMVYLTVVGLILYIVLYFVMPGSVDESFKIGIHAPELPPAFSQVPEEGLHLTVVASEDELKDAVINGDYIAGVSLPADIMDTFAAREIADVTLYFTPDIPEEAREAVELMIRELAFMQTGQTLSVNLSGEILGQNTIGQPVAPRDRMRPLLAVLILMMEMLALSNLLAEEVEKGTARALLVTPMSIRDLFAAKGVTGTGLAFIQAMLFMILVGGLSGQPLLIIVTLLIGAVFVTGVAFIVASISKDFMSVLGWGMLAFLVSAVPAFGVLFPGAMTGWAKVIPTYYLVDTVHRAANFGSGWGDLWPNLAILLGCCAVVTWLGIVALRRKFI